MSSVQHHSTRPFAAVGPRAPLPDVPVPQPTTVGPWRLIRELGEGRWSRVFLAAPLDASDLAQADYSLKILKPQFAQNPICRAMLHREAFLGQFINHPHLASVLSAQIQRSPQFLVMPYQPGEAVSQQLASRTRFTVSQSVWVARQIAEGICELHRLGWLHGDVKPANAWMARNGHVTLCDFGFARRFEELQSDSTYVAGTPAYLAPEFFLESGGEPGAASDIYSLGVMLFELLTGQLPYSYLGEVELAAAHRLMPVPDVEVLRSDLPPHLCRLLRRMLSKEPRRRPNAEELVELLVDLEIDVFENR